MNELPHSIRMVTGSGGLPMIRIDGPQGWAEIYLHGGHVSAWGPSGSESLLWLSGSSRFDAHTAIRGGIPVCFPWFGPLAGSPDAPRHGFARTAVWALDGAEDDGRDVTVRLRLEDSPATRASAWPHPFRVTSTITIGSMLSVALDVANTGDAEMTFEEALHTYLRVADVTTVEVDGLEGVPFVDKTDGGATHPGDSQPLRIAGEVDRIYPGAPAIVTVKDMAGGREFRIGKSESGSTVVWNPGSEGARATADLDDEGWTVMLCVEASNVGPAAIRLGPGAHHTMTTTIKTGLLGPATIAGHSRVTDAG